MHKIILAFLSILYIAISSSHSLAQSPKERYYDTGEIACRETPSGWPADASRFHEEKVEVFNRSGELVYNGTRRDYAGHSSVNLSFYPNGGVHKIETSSAPDAGIQWFKSNYVLDENGGILSFWEDSHDRSPMTTPSWPPPPKPDEISPPKAPNECATPMATQVVLYNRSRKMILARIEQKYQSDEERKLIKVAPGDSLVSSLAISAEFFAVPNDRFSCFIQPGKRSKTTMVAFDQLPSKSYISDPQRRVYQYYWLGDNN